MQDVWIYPIEMVISPTKMGCKYIAKVEYLPAKLGI
jgi:hypothetical protein